MTSTATAVSIDLREPYHREIVAHMLTGTAANIAGRLTGGEGAATNIEPPAVDRMIVEGFHTTLDPYLADLNRLAAVSRALGEVSDPNRDSVEWPFTQEETNDILKTSHPSALLCESMSMWPADRLVELASAVAPADAVVATLRGEVAA